MSEEKAQIELSIAQQLANWADQLRHVSANGLHYSLNVYDQTNYQTVQNVAMEMLAMATGEAMTEIEPLRAPIFARPSAIPTADAAIIDAAGRILLIRRADNRKWAMPGGGTDVGETPAHAAEREALEETGVSCEAVALVAVHDSRLSGSSSRHQLYHMTFLCQPLFDIPRHEPASHSAEVLETAWFNETDLPPSDELDPGHLRRIPEAFRVWKGDTRAFFDK